MAAIMHSLIHDDYVNRDRDVILTMLRLRENSDRVPETRWRYRHRRR